MATRAGPGSLENDGRGSGGGGDRREGGNNGQHCGWQTRERCSASSQPPLGRSPLREAPAGNREGSAHSRSRRPHVVPCASNAGGSCAGGKQDTGITLRCMYTHQKAKKRKTWSDGAVKCCPKRQRVSLYRWSDALGVTDKLLGEIYLTAPQYEAFVSQGEPELEMETFLVSLDGVIQPDNGLSTGATSSAAGGGAESATAGGASCGAGAGGKKRKLFKAFKPPARRTPPPAPPSDASWGELRNRGPSQVGTLSSSDGRGMMSPHASFTGFGHVESLWDDDDDDDNSGGEVRDRRGDRAGPADSTADRNSGWGVRAGACYLNPRDGGGGGAAGGTFPGRTQSSLAAAALDTSEWMSGQGVDGQHLLGRNTSSAPSRPVGGDLASDFGAQQDMPRFEDPAHRGQDQRDHTSSYLGSLPGGDRGAESWPGSAERSAQGGGAHGIDRARDQGLYDSRHRRYDRDGPVVGEEGEPMESNAVSQRGGGVVRAPEAGRQPAGRQGGGGGVGAGAVEMRSTQDILSLFGGLEEDGDDDGHGSPGPTSTPLQQSRGQNNVPARPEAARGALLPACGGMPRAADMRRAQKETRAAAGGAKAAVGGAGHAGAVDPEASVAAGVAPTNWTCDVCGVRGGASTASCRVCGAARQKPMDEGILGRGVRDDHPGVVDDFSGSEHQHGWRTGAVYRGEGGWPEQAWGGIPGEGNADGDGGEGHGGLDGGRAEGNSMRGEQDVAELRHPGSPFRSPSSSRPEREREIATEGVAGSAGSAPRAASEHRVAGARMQIDVGSSSDSEDA